MTKAIPLSKGYSAIVDDDDYEPLMRHKWYANVASGTVYAMRKDGSRKCHYMHRDLMDAPRGYVVDHIDRNGLNNTKANLRVATHSQNFCNRKPKEGAASKFLGVSKNRNKWVARIRIGGVQRTLGRYENEQEAALAYDRAAREFHGEFARPNFFEVRNG
jgi:hypothetical protein